MFVLLVPVDECSNEGACGLHGVHLAPHTGFGPSKNGTQKFNYSHWLCADSTCDSMKQKKKSMMYETLLCF